MATQVQSNGHTPTTMTVLEHPASATLRVVSASGFEVLLTTRAGRMADLLSQLATLESWLVDHQWQAAPTGKGKPSQGDAANGVQSEAAPICAIHNKPMTRRTTKDGTRSFWSCSGRLSDGSYCPYRPPKQ